LIFRIPGPRTGRPGTVNEEQTIAWSEYRQDIISAEETFGAKRKGRQINTGGRQAIPGYMSGSKNKWIEVSPDINDS
jgi:hypothetical protein